MSGKAYKTVWNISVFLMLMVHYIEDRYVEDNVEILIKPPPKITINHTSEGEEIGGILYGKSTA